MIILEIINLDYPWVMTPLSNTMGNFSVYVLTKAHYSKVKMVWGM
jgi:hypothetical protein